MEEVRWTRITTIAIVALALLAGAASVALAQSPVTDDRLLNADKDPNNWLTNHRTYNGWRYSPLSQIDSSNARRLVAKWSLQLGELGDQQATPLVNDGVMYIPASSLTRQHVYAVNAATGALLWKTKVDDHPVARVTGSPQLHAGRLYVPVSSIEEVSSGNPGYECCKFRGSVVALDARSGKQIWKTYTIPDPPTPGKKKESGVQLYGPSGAAIWSAPTLDLKRKALYVGTGNSYSDPPARTS